LSERRHVIEFKIKTKTFRLGQSTKHAEEKVELHWNIWEGKNHIITDGPVGFSTEHHIGIIGKNGTGKSTF
jgi:ATPase subunit of ABC transporter with duplicated ATPase domains